MNVCTETPRTLGWALLLATKHGAVSVNPDSFSTQPAGSEQDESATNDLNAHGYHCPRGACAKKEAQKNIRVTGCSFFFAARAIINRHF